MLDLLWLIPMFPLVGFLLLFATIGKLPKLAVALVGAGSVGLAALLVAAIGYVFLYQTDMSPTTVTLYTWIHVGDLSPGISFYLDALTLTMLSVITGVGFLIHLYSTLFMLDEDDYSRFFAYMNLFVCAMLILVMADNLLLLFMGWEGVGLCSYLLIGFWHTDPANGAAARKAFIVTRVGDTFMALGLFLLFMHLGTLEIQPLMAKAKETWQVGAMLPTLAAFLLLGGAVGKSAQLPLQTWLPDAMAGPTPVSALIHAATMVTAGVYLIARTHELFLLAPDAQFAVAMVGLITLIMAGCTALTQTDIKRILAYSTISQIGYMFLALGVGAWSAGIFHLMTHAFFKALLFLGAGAVIFSLHHEHDIFKMGGLRNKLPVAFWSFLIGSAALAALPPTSGFFSKDAILLSAWYSGPAGPWLWAGGVLGAFITSIYSFRLFFVVFYGEAKTEPSQPAGRMMSVPLVILCVLAVIGGLLQIPLENVFPVTGEDYHGGILAFVTPAIPIAGVIVAIVIFYKPILNIAPLTESGLGKTVSRFWFSHWAMDWLYNAVLVSPYERITAANKNDIVDYLYNGTAAVTSYCHTLLAQTQTGLLRFYTASMALGLVVLIAVLLELI